METLKRTLSWLSALLAAMTVFVTVAIVTGFIGARVVLTDSMVPQIKPGDIVVSYSWLEPRVNDIAVYQERDIEGVIKQDVVHRITSVNADGKYIFKGDANKSEDALAVAKTDVLGVLAFTIPSAGGIISSNTMVPIILIIVGVVFLSLGTIWLYRAFKDDETAENQN